MQVAHHNDHITHAVIGGQKAIEFGISSSAEFFNILSSTLYKDQILAVVREVLCNAWDAHIEAGCTDRPVLITLTQDKFTIQDFGKGIHQDDMGLIYGTYGNSTKKNDGNQTGGFGLGCKAPFAYTDHFEVASCHAGTRTIYNLSKSSAQAMGKPGITPIASFPSEESGLTVSIRIKPSDYTQFKVLIQRIAHNGDMNMQLNGEQIHTLDFDVSKGNFLLTRHTLLANVHRVMVRYGNVIYPAESAKNEQAYSAIVNHLNTLKGVNHHHQFSIVFQAPAHSIAVTPSRESLSMQDHTVNTLAQLFDGFLKSLDTEFQAACKTYTETLTLLAVTEKRVDELLKREESLPRIGEHTPTNTIADFETMACTYMQYNYPEGLAYRKADVAKRLEAMVQNNLLDRGKVQSFLRELKGVQKEPTGSKTWRISSEPTTWLQRRVISPLLVGLVKAGLPTHCLFTCGTEDHNWTRNDREGVPPLVSATRSSPHHLLVTLPYLRNIVVISTKKHGLVERAYRHEVFKKAGRYYGFMVYIAGRKKGELEAARQFFAQQGMQVADLTLQEQAEVAVRAAPTPRKPAKKGVIKLSSMEYSPRQIQLDRILEEDAERTETPEFILQVSLRNSDTFYSFDGCNHSNSATLVHLFGDQGGITNSTATYTKWRKTGIPSFADYVQGKICSYVLNNPRIKEHRANYSAVDIDRYGEQANLIQVIQGNAVLSKEFGLVNPLTDEDRTYLALWEGLRAQHNSYTLQADVQQVIQWLSDIQPSPAAVALVKQTASPLLPLINTSAFRAMVRGATPGNVELAVKFLKIILNP